MPKKLRMEVALAALRATKLLAKQRTSVILQGGAMLEVIADARDSALLRIACSSCWPAQHSDLLLLITTQCMCSHAPAAG